jgi:Zn-dependent alcohol dehydrogenase
MTHSGCLSFPYKIGYDCAGIVTEIGQGVTRFKVGHAVYVRLPESCRGILSIETSRSS